MDELSLRTARSIAVATSRRGFLGWLGKGAAIAVGAATAVALGTPRAYAQPSPFQACCIYACGGRFNRRTECRGLDLTVSDACKSPPPGCVLVRGFHVQDCRDCKV
jgi:hypothetical protein